MLKRLLRSITAVGLAVIISAAGVVAAESDESVDVVQGDLTTLEGTLKQWDIQSLDNLEPLETGEVAVLVELDHVQYVLALEPYSMRSADFRVQVQIESGELIDFEPPPPATYRGSVVGLPGSVVAASVIDGKLTAVIDLGGDEQWFIEPLSEYDDLAGESEHVIYRSSDTIPTDHTCGNYLLDHPEEIGFELKGLPGNEFLGAGSTGIEFMASEVTAEIAFDTDYEFFTKNNSNVGNTIADIEDVLNGVEVVYQRDVEICYNITHIIVRSSSNDPYTSSDPVTLLNQFRSEWNAFHAGIDRDTAHMMTGRNMYGGTIGIAWLTVICNRPWAYGLSESRYTSNFNYRIALTAHEIGHNWSANHCNGNGDCHIMCSGIGGCNGIGLPNFGFAGVNEITYHKNSRTCLDGGCGSVLDLIEPDPGLAGQTSTISVRGAAPGATVEFFFGVQPGATNVPGCPGLTLDLAVARSIAVVTANSDGIATLTVMVPPGASGRTLRLQAADESSCEISEVVIYSFP